MADRAAHRPNISFRALFFAESNFRGADAAWWEKRGLGAWFDRCAKCRPSELPGIHGGNRRAYSSQSPSKRASQSAIQSEDLKRSWM